MRAMATIALTPFWKFLPPGTLQVLMLAILSMAVWLQTLPSRAICRGVLITHPPRRGATRTGRATAGSKARSSPPRLRSPRCPPLPSCAWIISSIRSSSGSFTTATRPVSTVAHATIKARAGGAPLPAR
jgi:hypothetical protein